MSDFLENNKKNNTGNENTGDFNTGHKNSGHWNTGDCNTGDCNTGDWNTGDCNTGDCNTGDWNTGNRNTGDWNTGDFNAGNCNAGNFNTITPTLTFFNKPSDCTMVRWIESYARKLLTCMPINKDDRQEWWDRLSEDEKREVMALPNFDPFIFEKCTGIKVSEEEHDE